MTKQLTTQQFFNQDKVKDKFNEILGKESTNFITSVIQSVSGNSLLAKCDTNSIFQAAATAAVLNLPINNNLGLAYIVPYGGKAQFQLGYKGFIRLAIRSGEYETISSALIYEGQLKSNNPLTGYEFDFNNKVSDKIIGFASYFKLKNGFSKMFYMTSDEMLSHAKKYSKSYNSNSSIWKSDFNGMAQKTVLKLLISKYGPMSLEMQKAVISDQSVIKNHETNEVVYPDNNSVENETEDVNAEFMDEEIEDEDII